MLPSRPDPMKIADFLPLELVIPRLHSSAKPDVLRELAARVTEVYPRVPLDDLVRVLVERERLGSTALGEGVAIPHAKIEQIGRLVACFARSRKGVDFEANDGSPSYFFFLLLAPAASTGEHLKALARISRLFRRKSLRSRLMEAETAEEILAVIEEEDAASH